MKLAGEALTASAVETISRTGGLVGGRAGGHRPTLRRTPHDFADSVQRCLRPNTNLSRNLREAASLRRSAVGGQNSIRRDRRPCHDGRTNQPPPPHIGQTHSQTARPCGREPAPAAPTPRRAPFPSSPWPKDPRPVLLALSVMKSQSRRVIATSCSYRLNGEH